MLIAAESIAALRRCQLAGGGPRAESTGPLVSHLNERGEGLGKVKVGLQRKM